MITRIMAMTIEMYRIVFFDCDLGGGFTGFTGFPGTMGFTGTMGFPGTMGFFGMSPQF